MLLKIT